MTGDAWTEFRARQAAHLVREFEGLGVGMDRGQELANLVLDSIELRSFDVIMGSGMRARRDPRTGKLVISFGLVGEIGIEP